MANVEELQRHYNTIWEGTALGRSSRMLEMYVPVCSTDEVDLKVRPLNNNRIITKPLYYTKDYTVITDNYHFEHHCH